MTDCIKRNLVERYIWPDGVYSPDITWGTTKERIEQDIDRWSNNSDYSSVKFPRHYIGKLWVLFFKYRNKNFRALFYYRLGKLARPLRLFFKPAYKDFYLNCPDISGGGLFFAHPFGLSIQCEHIGYGCSFMNDTIIGNKPKNGKVGLAYLEEGVKVGTHVVIVGKIRIGRGAKIGAGSVVMRNVPPYAIVLGNPAKVVGFTMKPEDIVEYEKDLYEEKERYSLSLLQKNYEKYFLNRQDFINDFIKM